MNNPFLALDQQLFGDIYTHTEVMDNLTVLCDEFGSRFGGTEGERLAMEFMQAKLREYGLSHVHTEPVHYLGWRRGPAKLTILEPIEKEITCISLPHSPSATLEGVLVDMGDGAPKDFDKRAEAIKGNIVMTTSANPKGVRRWIHRNERLGRSIMAGATGFIFVSQYPAYGPETGGIGHEDGESLIPGISVGWEDGAYLQRLIKRHGQVRIRLETNDTSEPMVSWNVIADLPGKQNPETIIMLGCHYDGHDISQGAEDPASGTVAVIEAARVLAKYAPDLPVTVRFALWGVEEIGLLGSSQYAAAHATDLPHIRFYLNMDSAGAITNKAITLNEWPTLEPLFSGWAEEMAYPLPIQQSIHAHSDHFPFLMAGVPTGGIEGTEFSGRGYGHTRYDTLDKVKLNNLREAAMIAARLAVRIAHAPEWPVQHRTTEEVIALFAGPEYKEEAEYRTQFEAFYQKAREEKK
ncbi:MAG: M28 family peptidase [Chloroflexi bacterium]|nr:M28 family peptidase [Chloroflexota bacterium]MBP8055342.1 M28 family peptidase [Chloroflexota bacterium]